MKTENILLDLNEGSFPIVIKKSISDLPLIENLGVIEEEINIDIKILKLQETLFISEGNISLVIKSKCQKCFKSTKVKLDIDLKVGIKDKRYEAKDRRGPLDIHYQNLNLFDLEKLIVEEIHLNFPSFIVCCNKETDPDEGLRKPQMTRPFKKIRDLIK
tara:strand:+ start:1399 stop:1875 length:477 start_codon:yes stop_codon:yes gene_type:complete